MTEKRLDVGFTLLHAWKASDVSDQATLERMEKLLAADDEEVMTWDDVELEQDIERCKARRAAAKARVEAAEAELMAAMRPGWDRAVCSYDNGH